jgi:hypothetical protein
MGHVREYSMVEGEEALRHCGFTIEESKFRDNVTVISPLRNVVLTLCPSLANELLILARGPGTSRPGGDRRIGVAAKAGANLN